MVMLQDEVMTFRMVQVDAVLYDDQWVYNDTSFIGEFTAKMSVNACKKFRNELNKRGIKLKPGFMKVVDHSDVMEVQMIKTGKPLYAAILM